MDETSDPNKVVPLRPRAIGPRKPLADGGFERMRLARQDVRTIVECLPPDIAVAALAIEMAEYLKAHYAGPQLRKAAADAHAVIDLTLYRSTN